MDPTQNDPGTRAPALHARTARTLLAALLVAQVAASGWWMDQNGFFVRPPHTEAAEYRLQAQPFLMAIMHRDAPAFFAAVAAGRYHHSAFVPIVGACVGAAFYGDLPPVSLWLTEALFGALLALGAWRLARNFGGHVFALAVVAVTITSPVVIVNLRPFYLQLPLAAATTWALDALIRCRGFQRRGWSCAFGFWAGLATLGKILAPLYLAGGVALVLVSVMRSRPTRRAGLVNAGLALVIAGVIVTPLLATNLSTMVGYTRMVLAANTTSPTGAPLWSWVRWTYYVREFGNTGVGIVLWAITATSAVVAVVRRRRRARDAMAGPGAGSILVASVIVAWGILTVGQAGSYSQYILGFIPLAAVLVCVTIAETPSSHVRRALMALVAAACLWNAVVGNRSFPDDQPTLSWHGIDMIGRYDDYITVYARAMQLAAVPEAEPWPVREFAETMLTTTTRPVPMVHALHPYIGGENLAYEAGRLGRRLEWTVDGARLPTCEFVVADSMILGMPAVLNGLDRLGYDVTDLAHVQVTPHSDVHLLRIRRRG